MLKKRIIANLVVRNGIVVQSIHFKKFLPIGEPAIAVDFLNQWGIDEIILTDINANILGNPPDFKLIRKVSSKGYVPLTVGGGITQIDQIKELMHSGADKISLNRGAIHNPDLITKAASVFGSQCIIISIDAKMEDNEYKVYDYATKKTLNISPAQFAKQREEMGAGEILINSVERDGSYKGYDINLIQSVCDAVSIPVICLGGAKNAKDMIDVFKKTRVTAAAASNFFHFSEHSVITTKAGILKHHNIRIDTYADYQENTFNEDFRLKKKEDAELEKMLFLKIEKEII
ncbi:MAG TPA: imidazole glycerol phosphate synthase cyclase subunit [Bacteroidia bacterium]|jgi:cyclase|nr:imidazole glycerol phosphate synthase cyclase subunit [Bacteroidia bacterium]